ncbi:MAG: FMN-binding glutamate synthase family protein [Candidatus Omnitrophica bacterium]|nr:FMN-binding glutamate synthase family protein [Candidatus Omnitrophota bacterium]
MWPIIHLSVFILISTLIMVCMINWMFYTVIAVILFLFAVGIHDLTQKKHTILRNFPVIGHLRYLLETIAPEIHQYFIESNTDGKPIDRNHRSYIYKRAKLQNETHPFGTELDLESENFSWMQHSIYPAKTSEALPRTGIGGGNCTQPYSASIFNISAMSFGALSKNAVTALNLGAKAGGFFHDTGEGGIADYHLQGGDLVYELGTGYFGSRNDDGSFSPEKFRVNAAKTEVKMIEIKLSQGAKPGHGGILPAPKNCPEIARIRGVEPFTEVVSPPGHRAFSDADGLLKFVDELRRLSDGKPVGFKLCIGNKNEFEEICRKMTETGIKPDFITIDGAEGGTGSAPIDFSNYVGMPWERGLVFAVDTVNGYGLKQDIAVLTATKIITAFDIFKALCIGADVCSSARGMMMALGCIQALKCNNNECPTGVATQNPRLVRGLVVEEKWKRVKNYHHETVRDFLALMAAAGCTDLSQLNRSMIHKKVNNQILSYREIYPDVPSGSYLK